MRTEDLIDALAADTPPTPPAWMPMRLAAAAAGGGVIAFGVLLAWLGVRPDLAAATRDGFFWVKLAYPTLLAAAGGALIDRYGRPGASGRTRWLLVAAPVALLALVALAASLGASPERVRADWLGHSWRVCALHILVLSTPVFVGLVWAFRRLAPTRLRLAGFAAGLTAGGIGGAVYCLACDETAALFVLTWYSFGVFACAAIGAVLGPRLLRW